MPQSHDQHESGEYTAPMPVTEVRRMLDEDALHHVADDPPTRPDLGERGEVGCPACHGGMNCEACITCRGTATVSSALFAEWHARGEPR